MTIQMILMQLLASMCIQTQGLEDFNKCTLKYSKELRKELLILEKKMEKTRVKSN